jgi:hypothetical protein
VRNKNPPESPFVKGGFGKKEKSLFISSFKKKEK